MALFALLLVLTIVVQLAAGAEGPNCCSDLPNVIASLRKNDDSVKAAVDELKKGLDECKKANNDLRNALGDLRKDYDASKAKTACPSDWTVLNDGAQGCYKIVQNPMNWGTAFQTCKNLGANLAIITNKEQSDAVTAFVAAAPYGNIGGTWASIHTWIGMQREKSDSCSSPLVWKRSDGTNSPVGPFTNWVTLAAEPGTTNAPDCVANKEFCVEIARHPLWKNKWNDLECELQGWPLCKKIL